MCEMNIEVKKVYKNFNGTAVVDDLSFQVKSGQIVGLLGPNGAGKTTTLRMILDILKPDEGAISFDKNSISRQIKNRIGYLPEERGLYQKYRVIDVLIYFGRLKNLNQRKSHVEAVRLLDSFDMIELMDEPIGHLSKGTQQKLQFLVSLIHDPEVLILDEPFWGLDPINQELVKDKINVLKDKGKSILFSTHLLGDAENMCDYFVVIHRGRSVLQGTLEQIRKKFYRNMVIVETKNDPSTLRKIDRVREVEMKRDFAFLYLDANAPVKDVMKDIINRIDDIRRIELHKPSLNDIFLQTVKSSS
jgi:ABC-2 type transport system ATP-binding protein